MHDDGATAVGSTSSERWLSVAQNRSLTHSRRGNGTEKWVIPVRILRHRARDGDGRRRRRRLRATAAIAGWTRARRGSTHLAGRRRPSAFDGEAATRERRRRPRGRSDREGKTPRPIPRPAAAAVESTVRGRLTPAARGAQCRPPSPADGRRRRRHKRPGARTLRRIEESSLETPTYPQSRLTAAAASADSLRSSRTIHQ
uniref:Uncharacterized protein n=1 Tax=Plectus sambesii TaxID=2011161 RepID=A0A914V797_9BILA